MEYIATIGTKRIDQGAHNVFVSDLDGSNSIPCVDEAEAVQRTTELNESPPRLIVAPTTVTGIGWYAVKRWNNKHLMYEHVASFRGARAALDFIRTVAEGDKTNGSI